MGSFDQQQKSSANAVLADAIRAGVEARLLDMHTMIPGQVVSYDKDFQTCEVAICIKRSVNGVENQLPTLKGIPVNFSRSASAGTTFILKKGDGVSLVFSERNLDKFKTAGAGFIPIDARKFDLSDAVAFPGLFPIKGAMFPPQEDATELRGEKIFAGDPSQVITPILTTPGGPPGTLAPALATSIPLGKLDVIQIMEAFMTLMLNCSYGGAPTTGGGGIDTLTKPALTSLIADLGKLKV